MEFVIIFACDYAIMVFFLNVAVLGKNANLQFCFQSIATVNSVRKFVISSLSMWLRSLSGFKFLPGIHPHAVRKRTPRVPVSYSYRRNDTESYIPPNKRVKKSDADDNDAEHVAALTLTGALQRGGSPQVSQTPYKRAECRRSSPVQSYDRTVYDL